MNDSVEESAAQSSILDTLETIGGITSLIIESARELFRPPFYGRLLLEQMYLMGVRSLSLVLVTGLATGSVMALQFGYGLAKFGGTLYIPKIVALSILREMGPVFTSLLVAGRVGSGIASEVASMAVTQQIDAIRALGTSPIQRIVLPRVLAACLTLPILTILADFVGLWSAMIVSSHELQINSEFFIAKSIETLRLVDLWTGLVKTSVFAFIMSIVACYRGLTTTGGTQGVGAATTWVVVTSCIGILISDYFLTKFFILTVLPGQ